MKPTQNLLKLYQSMGAAPTRGNFYCPHNKPIKKGFNESRSTSTFKFSLHRLTYSPAKPRYSLKLISVTLAAFMTLQSIGWSDTGSLLIKPAEIFSNKNIRNSESLLGNARPDLTLLKDSVQAVSHFQGQKEKIVFHLEDAHLEPDAQKKIAHTIQELSRNWGVKTVGVEGASGMVRHEKLSNYPNRQAREILGNYLLKEGFISGSEYAALVYKPSLKLLGMEEASLYEANRKAFLAGFKQAASIEAIVKPIDRVLKSLAAMIFSEELRALRLQHQKWISRELDFFMYGVYLNEQLKKQNISGFFPQIGHLVRLYHLEKKGSIDFKEPLQNQITAVEQFLEFKTHETALTSDIFSEIEKAEELLKEKLITNEDQRKLDHWMSVVEILKKLVRYELTESEARFFEENRSSFESTTIQIELNNLLAKFKIDLSFEKIEGLDRVVRKAEAFYEYALKRDEVIARNAIRHLENSKEKSMVLVTGGFHTAGIQKALMQKGISYLTLRPVISKMEESWKTQKRYLREMQAKPSVLEKIAPTHDPLFQVNPPTRFPTQGNLASAFVRSGHQILIGAETVLRNQLPSSVKGQKAKLFKRGDNGVLLLDNRNVVFWGTEAAKLGLKSEVRLETSSGLNFYYDDIDPTVAQKLEDRLNTKPEILSVSKKRSEVRKAPAISTPIQAQSAPSLSEPMEAKPVSLTPRFSWWRYVQIFVLLGFFASAISIFGAAASEEKNLNDLKDDIRSSLAVRGVPRNQIEKEMEELLANPKAKVIEFEKNGEVRSIKIWPTLEDLLKDARNTEKKLASASASSDSVKSDTAKKDLRPEPKLERENSSASKTDVQKQVKGQLEKLLRSKGVLSSQYEEVIKKILKGETEVTYTGLSPTLSPRDAELRGSRTTVKTFTVTPEMKILATQLEGASASLQTARAESVKAGARDQESGSVSAEEEKLSPEVRKAIRDKKRELYRYIRDVLGVPTKNNQVENVRDQLLSGVTRVTYLDGPGQVAQFLRKTNPFPQNPRVNAERTLDLSQNFELQRKVRELMLLEGLVPLGFPTEVPPQLGALYNGPTTLGMTIPGTDRSQARTEFLKNREAARVAWIQEARKCLREEFKVPEGPMPVYPERTIIDGLLNHLLREPGSIHSIRYWVQSGGARREITITRNSANEPLFVELENLRDGILAFTPRSLSAKAFVGDSFSKIGVDLLGVPSDISPELSVELSLAIGEVSSDSGGDSADAYQAKWNELAKKLYKKFPAPDSEIEKMMQAFLKGEQSVEYRVAVTPKDSKKNPKSKTAKLPKDLVSDFEELRRLASQKNERESGWFSLWTASDAQPDSPQKSEKEGGTSGASWFSGLRWPSFFGGNSSATTPSSEDRVSLPAMNPETTNLTENLHKQYPKISRDQLTDIAKQLLDPQNTSGSFTYKPREGASPVTAHVPEALLEKWGLKKQVAVTAGVSGGGSIVGTNDQLRFNNAAEQSTFHEIIADLEKLGVPKADRTNTVSRLLDGAQTIEVKTGLLRRSKFIPVPDELAKKVTSLKKYREDAEALSKGNPLKRVWHQFTNFLESLLHDKGTSQEFSTKRLLSVKIMFIPLIGLAVVGMFGFLMSLVWSFHVRGLTAQAELDAEKAGIDMSDPAAAQAQMQELVEKQGAIDEMRGETEPPRAGFWGLLFILVFEVISIILPLYAVFGLGWPIAVAAKIYLGFRAGMILGAFKNEWGHSLAALFTGHGLSAGNLFGNRSIAWPLKFIPFSWFVAPPYVFFEEVPSKKQEMVIRHGGYWISILMTVALAGLWSFFPFSSGFMSQAFISGLMVMTIYNVTDIFVKNTNPRFFLCGNFLFFIPMRIGLVQTFIEIFRIVRILSLRGTDGIGMISWYDLRSTTLLTAALSVVCTVVFWSALALLTSASGLVYVIAIFPAVILAYLLTRGLEPGAVSDRIRTIGTKRVDLALILITSLALRTIFVYMFAGRKAAWTLVSGHVRRATSSPNPKATQPQTWVHTTLWNMIFNRTDMLYLTEDGLETRHQWAEPAVGHNGDKNGFHYKAFGEMVEHNPNKKGKGDKGDIHRYLDASLASVNNDEGDTINAAGMMKKLVTQGNYRASLLLAYEQVVLQGKAPKDWAFSPRTLKKMTGFFVKEVSSARRRYFEMIQAAGDYGALENVPDEVLDAIAADLFKKFKKHAPFARLVPRAKQEEFVKYAVRALFRNNVLEALKNYATKLNPYDPNTPWIGGADGTHGLVVTSAAYNTVGLYQKGQPLAVGFTEDFSSFSVFSTPLLLNDGNMRYRLDLKDDEICYLWWDEHGTVQFVIYNVVEGRNVTREELEKMTDTPRIIDLQDNPDVGKSPDPNQMFPIEDHIAQIASLGEQAEQSVSNRDDQNFHTAGLLEEHYQRLEDYRRDHGHLPEGTHILLVGNMPNEASMELFQKASKDIFPDARVEIIDADEALRTITNYLAHPETALQKLGITSHTMLIPVSNSGEAFDTMHDLLWLCTQVENVMPILGDRDNTMASLVGPGRVLSTEVGSLRMSEINTHTSSTMDILILSLMIEMGKRLELKSHGQPILGGNLNQTQLGILRRGIVTLTQRLPEVTGVDGDGKRVTESKPRKQLLQLGRRISRYSQETFFSSFITAVVVGLLVALQIHFFPTQLMGPMSVFSIKFLVGLVLNVFFAYWLGKVITKVLRAVGFFRRTVTKRNQSPTVYVLEETTPQARRVELAAKLTMSFGYENAPKFEGEAGSKSNRRFSPSRGDVVVGTERYIHPSDKGADAMTASQTLGPRTDGFFNEAVEYFGIGHGEPKNPASYTGGYINMFTLDEHGRIRLPYPDVSHEEGASAVTLKDFMSHFLRVEREVAHFVWLNEHGIRMAFPGLLKPILKEGLLKAPYVKWPVYLFINRFPWFTRFFPFWHAHGGVLYPTTASTRDVSPVQTWVTQKLKDEGDAIWKVRKISKHSPHKASPVHIPNGVYDENYRQTQPLAPSVKVPVPVPAVAPRPKLPAPTPTSTRPRPRAVPAAASSIQDSYVEVSLAALEAQIAPLDDEARLNGALTPVLRKVVTDAAYMKRNNFPPALVHRYLAAAQSQIGPRFNEIEREVRSELRAAIRSKEELRNNMMIDQKRSELRKLMGDLTELGVDLNSSSTYFTNDHLAEIQKGTGLILSQDLSPFGNTGAYILTDHYNRSEIRSILDSLPQGVPLIVSLDVNQTTRAQRIELAQTFLAEIRQGRLVLAHPELSFESIVRSELRKRSMDFGDVVEISSGLQTTDNPAFTAMMSGAALLTNRQIVVLSRESRLNRSEVRHISFVQIYETLHASARATAASA